MTQVTFWTAYQDFVAPDPHPDAIPIPAAAVAGEVIKAATTAFSGASAMVMREDRDGRPLPQQKFVINGLRFKRSLGMCFVMLDVFNLLILRIGRRWNYMCKWQGCPEKMGPLSNAELLDHIKTCHLVAPQRANGVGVTPPIKCCWSNCVMGNATIPHMTTHLPLPIDPTKEPKPTQVVVHPDTTPISVYASFPHFRPVPPLSYIPSILPANGKGPTLADIVHPLAFEGLDFPTDRTGQPMQEGYYACMVLKNVARALREDIERAESAGLLDGDDDVNGMDGLGGDAASRWDATSRNRKKRKLDRLGAFGLPAPPGLLEGVVVDPALAANGDENGSGARDVIVLLSSEERQRARLAFRSIVQEPVLQIVEQSGGDVAKRLVECLGF